MAASVSESLSSAVIGFLSDGGKEVYRVIHLEEGPGQLYADIPTDQIYKKTMLCNLNFLSKYKIMSVEREVCLQNKQSDVYLLTREAVRSYRTKYDFLHIGLVQARVRSLIDRVHGPVLVCLRDSKIPNWKESVLAAFEISLDDDVSKFICFPNFSSSLSDLANSNGLVITVQPHGLHLKEEFEHSRVLEISYRMCYKLMKGSLKPKSLFENPVLEVNTEKTQVLVPKPNTRN